MILAMVGLVAGGVFGFVRARNASEFAGSGVPPTFFDAVVPGICTMERQLDQNQRAEASNTFWNTVHLPSHALAAELVPLDRSVAEQFQRAKLAVEVDLSTLAPDLTTSVVAFEAQARTALRIIGRPDADPCA